MSVEARYATPRDESRQTMGGKVAKIGEALGLPLMPWQRQVVDVALELTEDGRWAYPAVVVTVQRQAGKTSLLMPTITHRCLTKPQARCWLTAQRRQDARDTWLDVARVIRKSPLHPRAATIRESNGSESVTFGRSTFRPFAPNEEALHGKANELVAVDEAWAFNATQGADLEQAILPTFTATGGQLWIVSTAGHTGSEWLRSYVDRGRAQVDTGLPGRVAYFEWSIPDDVDPRDLEALLAWHPAAGHTLRLDALETAAELMDPSEFARAYGNRWTSSVSTLIPPAAWRDDATPHEYPTPGRAVALAFDAAPDRSSGAILAAWRDANGRPRVDVTDARKGDHWIADRVVELANTLGAVAVGYDAAGPALDIADRIRRSDALRVPLEGLSGKDYAAACSGFLAAVVDVRDTHRLAHHDQPDLNAAAMAAAKRKLLDTWAWGRDASGAPIPALVAATVALWTLDHAPKARQARVRTGKPKAA